MRTSELPVPQTVEVSEHGSRPGVYRWRFVASNGAEWYNTDLLRELRLNVFRTWYKIHYAEELGESHDVRLANLAGLLRRGDVRVDGTGEPAWEVVLDG